MFYRSLCGVVLGTVFLGSSLNASELIEIAPFTVMGYTKSFTKGFDASVEIKMMEDGQVTNATFLAEMLPGKPTKNLAVTG